MMACSLPAIVASAYPSLFQAEINEEPPEFFYVKWGGLVLITMNNKGSLTLMSLMTLQRGNLGSTAEEQCDIMKSNVWVKVACVLNRAFSYSYISYIVLRIICSTLNFI